MASHSRKIPPVLRNTARASLWLLSSGPRSLRSLVTCVMKSLVSNADARALEAICRRGLYGRFLWTSTMTTPCILLQSTNVKFQGTTTSSNVRDVILPMRKRVLQVRRSIFSVRIRVQAMSLARRPRCLPSWMTIGLSMRRSLWRGHQRPVRPCVSGALVVILSLCAGTLTKIWARSTRWRLPPKRGGTCRAVLAQRSMLGPNRCKLTLRHLRLLTKLTIGHLRLLTS